MLKKFTLIGLTVLIAFATAVLAPVAAMARPPSDSPQLQTLRMNVHKQLRKAGLKVVGPQTSLKNADAAARIDALGSPWNAWSAAIDAEENAFRNAEKPGP